MSNTFLVNLMNAAKKITHAERCLAVDTNLQVINAVNLEQSDISSQDFGSFAMDCLRDALSTGKPIITNNIITDPSEAPTTNTNFANLRVVVAVPIVGHGAIYLDQHIRNGIIPKQMIDRLMRLVDHLLATQQEHRSDAEMVVLYQQMGN